jgi:predicted RNA-binding protein associated with RNAse of E/G family
MSTPTIYRKRFIPNDITALKDDIILVQKKDLIITKWRTLRPRNDIASGISAYFIDKGYKISKIYNKDNQVVYWYCDIIQTKIDYNKNTVLFEDLLIDVILYKDGSLRIADLDELSLALEHSLISQDQTIYALRTLDSLLNIIYSGNFYMLQKPINEIEHLL